MDFSLERITKYLLLLALGLLMFRNGSFGASGIPKLFECAMIIVVILTAADLLRNKKFGDFFMSVPRRVWMALGIFYGATGIGWVLAVLVRQIPSTVNMLYEIGMFSVAVATFILILFYSRNDRTFIKHCFYALLVPGILALCVIVPPLAFMVDLARGGVFKGFTDNVEIISKILLVPGVSFATYALFRYRIWWHRIGYALLAIAMVALVSWTTERAAILGFFGGAVVVWGVYITRQRSWKKAIASASILIVIAVVGFLVVPHEGKKATIDRVLNTDANQSGYENIQHQTVVEVFQNSITTPSDKKTNFTDTEPRFRIWGYYLNQVIHNPFGLGPNTHMEARIDHPRRSFVNPGPHNAYLEAWLWGGVIGLLAIIYILALVFQRLYVRSKEDFGALPLAILGSLTALCIAIFFNDNLSSYWLWALLAISLRI